MLPIQQRKFANILKRAGIIKPVCREYDLIVVCSGVDRTCIKEIKGWYGNKGTDLT